jgi:hypothetical protein
VSVLSAEHNHSADDRKRMVNRKLSAARVCSLSRGLLRHLSARLRQPR